MRKMVTFATILGFIMTLSLNLTTIAKGSDDDKFKVSGRVIGIENHVIRLEEPNGQIFTVVAKNDDQIERIRVGDLVRVKYKHGRVDEIKRIGEGGYVPENVPPPPPYAPPPPTQ